MGTCMLEARWNGGDWRQNESRVVRRRDVHKSATSKPFLLYTASGSVPRTPQPIRTYRASSASRPSVHTTGSDPSAGHPGERALSRLYRRDPRWLGNSVRRPLGMVARPIDADSRSVRVHCISRRYCRTAVSLTPACFITSPASIWSAPISDRKQLEGTKDSRCLLPQRLLTANDPLTEHRRHAMGEVTGMARSQHKFAAKFEQGKERSWREVACGAHHPFRELQHGCTCVVSGPSRNLEEVCGPSGLRHANPKSQLSRNSMWVSINSPHQLIQLGGC